MTAWLKVGVSLLGAAVLVAFAGCGGAEQVAESRPSKRRSTSPTSESDRETWISIDGYKGPQTVGLLMAQKLGYFEDLGVEMTITSAFKPQAAIQYVREGESVDFGVTREPQVVLEEQKGVPIIAVGALVARPTAALIWLKKSGIDGISDLKGKTIAIPGLSSQENLLRSLLTRSGLSPDDVRIKRVKYRLASALANGHAAAIFGGAWNVEGAALAARGLRPVVRRVQSLGFPAYDEQVLVVRADWAAENGPLIRDVLRAVARGTAAAIEHPDAAARVIEKSDEPDPNATPKETEAEVEATLPLLSETGYMSSGQAENLIDWMQQEGWIKRTFPSSRLLTNDYLSIDER